MYTSEDYPDDYKVSLYMQTAFEDLLHKYQVDIAVWGHYHGEIHALLR
jgi:UDP-2,3-diacylglucosamine pyrophosphatase LpxH